ncbi:extracellular solute-binding protein family 1 [Spirochaeta thermophila DSM 6578]|uniref:Extracellular solute-binding protein family 1 n=1 Tax=Winmispira thermophila (strain ATCC 700085 / DSM 6578 / Z-1203) TaxID=869211 RepID=G0GE08_WINT7|nr:extracellular solute-binding protein [Spirochaeta thermophila]AEJ60640.1 extracellular solute-binding protein family 1 [Spirochaeta thermophila DSM 6578]
MRNVVKGVWLGLLMVLLSFGLWATGAQEGETAGGTQELKPVELVMWLVGDSVPDYELMLQELNKLTKEELNATIKVNFTTWTDWKTKLRLLLTSGEAFDLVHMAPWGIYQEASKLGLLLPLEDLAPKYAPVTWQSYSPDVLKQATVNGHVYMLPFNYTDPYGNGFLYRLDLAEKYGLGKIRNIEDLETYLVTLAKNEKGIIPYNAGEFDLTTYPETICAAMPSFPKAGGEDIIQGLMPYFYVFYDDPTPEPEFILEHPSFREAIEFSRGLYLAGAIPKGVLSNQVGSREAFINGTSAVTLLNPLNANEVYQQVAAKHPDWKLDYWNPYLNLDHPTKAPAINNGMSVPASSRNPQRALMFLEKLHQDQRYHDLTSYGIRGKHWDLDENGQIVLPEGVTVDSTGFAWDRPCPWGWREEKFYRLNPLKFASTWQVIKDWYSAYLAKAVDRKYVSFYLDKEPILAEFAAVDNLKTQYVDPLLWGIADPATYPEVMDKFYAAGLGKVKDEILKQWKAYMAQY